VQAQPAVLPPFQPVTLSWHDVSSEVPIPGFKDPRVVLSHVSGWAKVTNKSGSADVAYFKWALVSCSGRAVHRVDFQRKWSRENGRWGRCWCIVVQFSAFSALFCIKLHHSAFFFIIFHWSA
jgi:hypothetical protein